MADVFELGRTTRILSNQVCECGGGHAAASILPVALQKDFGLSFVLGGIVR